MGDIFGPRYDETPKDRLRSNADYVPLFLDKGATDANYEMLSLTLLEHAGVVAGLPEGGAGAFRLAVEQAAHADGLVEPLVRVDRHRVGLAQTEQVRRRLGLSQTELARRSGVSQSLIAKIETELEATV